MKGTALKPDFFMSKMPSLAADKEAEKKGATEEERIFYSLSKTKGWKLFQEYVDNVLTDLDSINEQAISSGATFETVGQNQVAINLVKSVIKRMMDKIQDAKESCERPDGTNR